jgi:hypothetical protein
VEILSQFNISALDMCKCKVVNILEEKMMEVADDGSKMLDKKYIMNMFSDLKQQIDPFDEYLHFIFEEKMSDHVGGSNTVDEKVILFDEIKHYRREGHYI